MIKKPYGKKMARAFLAILAVSAFALLAQMSGPTLAPAYTDGAATKLNDLQVDDLKLNGGDIVDTAGNVQLSLGTIGFRGPVPIAETIASAATITADACGGMKRITNPSAVTTGTTNTFTAPAAGNAGCGMFVINVGTSTITLDTNANFKSAGAANVALAANDAVGVMSDGSAWYQTTALLDN